MIFKCPTCRRKNDENATTCLRCGMELTALGQIIKQATKSNRQGLIALYQQQFTRAIAHFQRSDELYHNQQVVKNMTLAHLLQKRFQ